MQIGTGTPKISYASVVFGVRARLRKSVAATACSGPPTTNVVAARLPRGIARRDLGGGSDVFLVCRLAFCFRLICARLARLRKDRAVDFRRRPARHAFLLVGSLRRTTGPVHIGDGEMERFVPMPSFWSGASTWQFNQNWRNANNPPKERVLRLDDLFSYVLLLAKYK